VAQLHLSAIRSRKETEVVVLRYWKTTIFWSAKKPLVHADKGMVHLVVVEQLSRSLSPTACQILPVSNALPLFPVQNWKTIDIQVA
jgi:hypothetical protein